MHCSAYYGHLEGNLEVCRLLLVSRADIQAKANKSVPRYRDDYFYAEKLRFSFLLVFCLSGRQPLHYSACDGNLEICRLLVDSRADIQAKIRCCSPRRFRRLPLTLCVLATAELHSNWPSTSTSPTLLHICAALARGNDVLLRPAPPLPLLPAPQRKCSSSSCCRRCAVAAFDA